jgi:hypothetical protein
MTIKIKATPVSKVGHRGAGLERKLINADAKELSPFSKPKIKLGNCLKKMTATI